MESNLLHDLSAFGPELALTVALLLTILADLPFKRTSIPAVTVALGGLAATGVLLASQGPLPEPIFSGMIAVDPLAIFFKWVILVSAGFILLFSLWSAELVRGGRRIGEFFAFVLALTLGMMLMAGARNLLMMYLAIELSSIASYILSGYTREAPDSSEASLKYVIYGAASSGMMVYGISYLYGLTGSLGFAEVQAALAQGDASGYAVLIAALLIMVGLGYKISAVPFHFWTPDVYEGAPITITAFLSVASKAGGFALLIRFVTTTFGAPMQSATAGLWSVLPQVDWPLIVAILSVLTMTIGNLVAIWQDNLKRMLAYSSIAHAGYMLMGVAVLSNDGLAAILVYFVVYLFMNLGAFYVVMLVGNKTGSEDIEEYKGLGARAPVLATSFAIFLVSLTGLPPTAGFIGKLYLFAALVRSEWVWLAVVGALNSVIALYYYARVFRNMFLREGGPASGPLTFTMAQRIVLLLLLIPTVVLGIYPTQVAEVAQASVRLLGAP